MGSYKNIYQADEYAKRVRLLESGVKNLSANSFFKDVEGTLEREIAELEKREQEIFRIFPGVKTAEDLQNKLIQAIDETKELYGTGMAQQFTSVLKADLNEDDRIFSEKLYQLLEEEVRKAGNDPNVINVDELKDITFSILNEGLDRNLRKKGARFSKERAFAEGMGVRNIIKPLLLTRAQRARIEKLIGGKELVQTVEEKESSMTTYFSITEKKKGSELTEDEKKDINKKLKIFILAQCKSITNKILLSEIIDYILEQRSDALITGKSISLVEGILGEIQGLYIFCSLTGGNAALERQVKWKGGLLNKEGKEFHRDLLVNNFGIQVKNTEGDVSKGYVYDINFWTNKLTNFLDKMQLSGLARDIFEMYFATYRFNIPYIVSGEKFQRADRARESGKSPDKGKEFNKSYDALRALKKDVNELLSVFASSFLYMNVGTPLNADRNLLYLIGGTALVSASEILTHIKNELSRGGTTPIRVTSTIPSDNINIVTALNNNPKLLKTQDEKETLSNNLLAGITIGVDYRFKINNFRR